MGCHTWFYNDERYLDNHDLDLMRRAVARSTKSCCSYPTFESWLKVRDDLIRMSSEDENVEYYRRNFSKKEWKKFNHFHIRIRKRLEKKLLHRREIIKWAKSENFGEFSLRKGYYGLSFAGWHDRFRHYNYDAPEFHSYEEIAKYIDEHSEEFYVYDYSAKYNREKGGWPRFPDSAERAKKVCKEFFEKYPHGMIDFG